MAWSALVPFGTQRINRELILFTKEFTDDRNKYYSWLNKIK